MAMSIHDQFAKSQTEILTDSDSGISLLELEFGPTLFDLRDFQTTENASPHLARASRSRKPGSRKALRIDDTFGQSVFGSSESEDLSWSLANRFRVQTASLGSTLFQLTWKVSRTPQGRRVYVGRASARLTQETDCTLSGWQTPKLPSGGGQESRQSKGGGLRKLEDQALFASWATPTKRDGKDGAMGNNTLMRGNRTESNALLGRQVWLAGWGTPQKHDACGTKTEDAVLKMKEAGHGVVNLNE